jgi:hypothetical protein
VAVGIWAVAGDTAIAYVVTGGRTVLRASPAALHNLRERGVGVGATGDGMLVGGGVRLPIAGGDLREGPLGTVEHDGGLVFTSAPGNLALTDLEVRIGTRKGKVFAIADGARVRFFDLDLSLVTHPSVENPFRIKHVAATLAHPAAVLMTEELGARFRRGDPGGHLDIKPLVNAETRRNFSVPPLF